MVGDAGLVAPESQILTVNKVTNALDGFFTTVKFGLTGSFNGFDRIDNVHPLSEEGDTSNSNGVLTYSPDPSATVDQVIEDLSLLLTSGRLANTNQGIIKGIIENEYTNGNKAKALQIAQQLITTMPEFHTTGKTRKEETKRELSGYTAPTSNIYKAVSTLMLMLMFSRFGDKQHSLVLSELTTLKLPKPYNIALYAGCLFNADGRDGFLQYACPNEQLP